MKHKSETNQVIQTFVSEMELHYGTKIKAFRSDNSGEYINGDLQRWFASKGIHHEPEPPYSLVSNGIAE